MGLTSTFYIAQTGLQMAQTALEVISHNISNVNTPGYSRQTLNLETMIPSPSRVGPIGGGVDAANITRMYDQFVGRSLIEKSSTLAKYEAEKIAVDSIEAIFNESYGNGINEALSDFWNAWQDVANNPEGNPERVNLLEKADTLANHIKQSRLDMDSLKNDVNRQVEESIIQANALLTEIADLNEKIISMEAGNNQANDLRDTQEEHIKELASIMDIDYYTDPANGAVSVLTPKGTPLVMGLESWQLKATKDLAGDIHVEWVQKTGGSVDITEKIEQGRIGGLLEIRDDVMADFYNQFDAFTQGLIAEVNRQHSQGVGLVKFSDLTGSYAISNQAVYQTDLEGENNDIRFTARAEGSGPENVGIRFVKASQPGTQLSVETTRDLASNSFNITVTLPVNANGNVTVTAQEVIDCINKDVSPNLPEPVPYPPASGPPYHAGDLIRATIPSGQTGDGYPTALNDPADVLGLGYCRLNDNLENTLVFGREITPGFEKAQTTTRLDGDNNDLVFAAVNSGDGGEAISIEYVNPGAANQPLTVTVTGNAIQIGLGTDADGNVTTTGEDIIRAVSDDPAARLLVSVDNASGQTGAGIVTAMPAQYLDRSGSFDLFVYNSEGECEIQRIVVNPDDSIDDILSQIGGTFAEGVTGISAEIVEATGQRYIRLKADSGYEFAFGNDNANALMALGLNTFFSGSDNQTIAVNDLVMDNIRYIATGQLDENGLSPTGDNTNVLELADLKDKKFVFLGQKSSISEAFNTLTSNVGATTHTITRSNDFNQVLLDQITAQRDMVSAVNLDEEMANLLKFQYMYQASAKMISTTDEMLQVLMSIKS